MSRIYTNLAAAIAAIVACSSPSAQAVPGDNAVLEEVVVTAHLRDLSLQELPSSVSVIGQQQMRDRAAAHVEQLLNIAPNVNFASGASRARYVQIRGVGERSQFVDPVDPSVGIFVDDIDFTGLGNAATLLDVQQVEVLRGPQGTAFGASAMAGMINLRSFAPQQTLSAEFEGEVSEYGGSMFGGVVNAPLSDTLAVRIAGSHRESDGYIDNDFLNSHDTNNIDETTLRARVRWAPNDDTRLDLIVLHVDADNGYDAFSLDNTRHTLSDEPGQDIQESDAFAVQFATAIADGLSFETTLTYGETDSDYGYDEDWSYPGLCAGSDCDGWEYASTDRYLRQVEAVTADVRLLSEGENAFNWVLGAYINHRNTSLERQYYDFAYWPARPSVFLSDYDSEKDALYAQVDIQVSDRLTLRAGARMEWFESSYDDSADVDANPDERMWGGELSADFELGEHASVYALIARGYKAGGVNGEALGKANGSGLNDSVIDFLRSRLEYESESLTNYELGYRLSSVELGLSARAAVFWMQRDDVQLKSWYNEGPAFVGYTDNAASGDNYGLELEANWQTNQWLRLSATVGLLDTEIEGFAAFDPDNPDAGPVDRSGREQAHAPQWQFSTAAELALPMSTFARIEWEGRDAFFYSDSHDARSDSYTLLNLSAGYRGDRIELTAWMRNALDEDYTVRGFYFGNDPRDFYTNKAYVQYGEPRVAGVSARYRF